MVDRYSFNSAGEEWISDDGSYVGYRDYAELENRLKAETTRANLAHVRGFNLAMECVEELEKQRDGLVVENAALTKFIKKDCWVIDPDCDEYFDAAEYKPETPQTNAAIAEIGEKAVEQSDDKRRMDWLVSHVVEVRKPLFYGSHAMFFGQCDSDDCEEYHSKLREQIDAEISKENKLRGGGV